MRRTRPDPTDRSAGLVELRRVLRVVEHRPLRSRLTRLVDELEREAGWDQVEEIRATREVELLRAQLAEAQLELTAATAAVERAHADVGRARRERDDALARLAAFRELTRPELADDLVRLRTVFEAERPTSPPLLALGQAARLARAVRSN